MRPISELKDRALMSLSGKWVAFVAMTLIMVALEGVFSTVGRWFLPETKTALSMSELLPTTAVLGLSGTTLVMLLLFVPLAWGYQVMFLKTSRSGGDPDVGELFAGYKDYWRVTGTHLLMYLYEILWSLLLVIPGIIKMLSYSMTGYVLRDNPELSFNSAIERSMWLMDGHKADMFVLYLSFIGWGILSVLTCGIGFLWLLPYMQMTMTKFYEALLEEKGAQMTQADAAGI